MEHPSQPARDEPMETTPPDTLLVGEAARAPGRCIQPLLLNCPAPNEPSAPRHPPLSAQDRSLSRLTHTGKNSPHPRSLHSAFEARYLSPGPGYLCRKRSPLLADGEADGAKARSRASPTLVPRHRPACPNAMPPLSCLQTLDPCGQNPPTPAFFFSPLASHSPSTSASQSRP